MEHFFHASHLLVCAIHLFDKEKSMTRIPGNVNNRVEQGAEFTPDSAETSAASLPTHMVRSGHSNLQRRNASFGDQVINTDVSTPQGVERYKAAVHAWVDEAEQDLEKDERKKVEKCINRWLERNDPEWLLDLSDFPNIRDLPPLPSTLHDLDVHGTGIVNTPEKWPEKLTLLNISDTSITDIQESWPSGLNWLDMSGCSKLTRVPEKWPEELTLLDISDTPITNIPKSWPSGLEWANISHTRITEIPKDLPDTLIELNISHTRITKIPESLLQAVARLASPCVVKAEGTPVWGQVTLNSSTHALGVQNQYGVARNSRTLYEAVQSWYNTPDPDRQATWEQIQQEAQDAAYTDAPFRTLLDTLKAIAEHPAEAGDTAQAQKMREAIHTVFRKRITNLLDAIQENEELRRKCFEIAYDAVETCHDSVVLGFEDMELEHLKTRAAQGEFTQQELVRLGVGYFKLAILDELAQEKAYQLADEKAHQSGNADKEVETVEVMLAYRTRLATELDLPTQTKEMLYYADARITDDDLTVARKRVMQAAEDTHRLVSFLADWGPWKKDLERRHSEKLDRAPLERGKGAA